MRAPTGLEHEKVYLRQIEVGPMQNFVYLIGDKEKSQAVLVDPAWEVDPVLDFAESEGIEVVGGLVSHWHPDHTNQVERLLDRTKSKLHVNKHEDTLLERLAGRTDLVLRDAGDVLEVGDVKIRFLHTPGHTPGSQCFLVEIPDGEGALVSGDTLFVGACGRTDLPGGDPEVMFQSLETLKKLPDETVLLPGHDYADRPVSTIHDERETNPMLRFPSREAFVQAHLGRRR